MQENALNYFSACSDPTIPCIHQPRTRVRAKGQRINQVSVRLFQSGLYSETIFDLIRSEFKKFRVEQFREKSGQRMKQISFRLFQSRLY